MGTDGVSLLLPAAVSWSTCLASEWPLDRGWGRCFLAGDRPLKEDILH